MDSEEVNQLVTDYIISARELCNRYPDAALMWCRKANECLIHRAYFNHKQEYPGKDNQGKYPHLNTLLQTLSSFLSDQTKATFYSINALTRMAVHFDPNRLGKNSEKGHHIEPVVQQLISVYRDITDEELILEGLGELENRNVVAKTVREFVSSNLAESESSPSRIGKPSTGKEENVAELNTALDLADDLGIEFNSEDNLQLGEIALQGGRINSALKYFEQAKLYSSGNGDKLSEINSLFGLGISYSRTGSLEQSNEYYERALDISTELEDRGWESALTYRLGSNCHQLGLPENALSYLRRSISAANQTESRYLIEPKYFLGIIALRKGLLEDAERLMIEATEICNQYPEMAITQVEMKLEEGSIKLLQGDVNFNHSEIGNWCMTRYRELRCRAGEADAMFYLGSYHKSKNEYTLARKLFQDAFEIFSECNQISGMSSTLRELGGVALESGHSEKALEMTTQSLQLAKESNLLNHQAIALNNISLIHRHNGEYSLAKECLIKSLDIYRHMSDKGGIATSLNNLALICGDLEEAKQYLQESYEIAEQIDAKPLLVQTLSNLAEVESGKGNFDSALENIEACIEITESMGKRDRIASSLIVKADIIIGSNRSLDEARLLLNQALEILSSVNNVEVEVFALQTFVSLEQKLENFVAVESLLSRILSLDVPRLSRILFLREMATCLRRTGQDLEAEEKVREAMEIAETLGEESQVSVCRNDLGLIYSDRGEHEDAIRFYEQHHQYAEQNGITTEIQTSLHNLASEYRNLGNLEKSEEFHNKSISIARENEDMQSVALGLNNLGLLFIDMGDLDVALTHFHDSMEIALQVGIKRIEALACANMASVYSSQDQLDSELYERWTKKSISLRKEIGELVFLPRQIKDFVWFLINAGRNDEAKNQAIDLMAICDGTPFEAAGLAHGNNLLGLISDNTGNMDDALSFYSIALEIFEKLEDMESVATLYENQALVYHKLGYHLQFHDLKMKAIDSHRLIGNNEWLLFELNPFGLELLNHGEYDAAELLFDECLSIATEFGNKLQEAHSLNNLGVATKNLKRYDESVDFFTLSISLYEELEEFEYKQTTENRLAEMIAERDERTQL